MTEDGESPKRAHGKKDEKVLITGDDVLIEYISRLLGKI